MAVIRGTGGSDFLWGTDEDDVVIARGGNDNIFDRPPSGATGPGSNDNYEGGSGFDTLHYSEGLMSGVTVDLRLTGTQDTGGGGFDRLLDIEAVSGTAFADTITGNKVGNFFTGGEGEDVLAGGAGDDTMDAGGDADSVSGNEGNDSLSGGVGNDTVMGGRGDDTLDGYFDDDLVSGGNGADSLSGGIGDDTLSGDGGRDTLFGGTGKDGLTGGDGDDALSGDDGADTLNGGAGADLLTGGADADTFVFTARSDSRVGAYDTITDFEGGVDVLDLSALDADSTADGDQAFHLVFAFGGRAGELLIFSGPGGGEVLGDTDGNGRADFRILFGGAAPLATDIVL